ncbi:MAG: RNA polymerase sigma factor [Longimicrobiales bacterium]
MDDETTDLQLVSRAKAGDQDALGKLISRHEGVAFRVALGILRDEDEAADAAQMGCIKAFRAIEGFRGDSGFRTWLVTIVSNEARGLLRKRGRRNESGLDTSRPLADPSTLADLALAEDQQAQALRELLDELPDKQRLAVSLRVYDGMSFKEVGAVIESSEGSARVNYHHGIRRLRELMSHD